MTDLVDIDNLRHRLITILEKNEVDYDTKEVRRGTLYIIAFSGVVLEMCIGPEWVGYELAVSAWGKRIDMADDTDNYSLDDEFKSITLDIYDDLLACLDALLKGAIYAGVHDKKAILIVPLAKGRYRITTQGRLLGSSKEVETLDLALVSKLTNIAYKNGKSTQ